MENNLEELERHLLAQRQELSRLRSSSIGNARGEIAEMLGKIDEALEVVHEGSYGACRSCGAPIQSERLEALPYATRCIACQRREEQGGFESPSTNRPSGRGT